MSLWEDKTYFQAQVSSVVRCMCVLCVCLGWFCRVFFPYKENALFFLFKLYVI